MKHLKNICIGSLLTLNINSYAQENQQLNYIQFEVFKNTFNILNDSSLENLEQKEKNYIEFKNYIPLNIDKSLKEDFISYKHLNSFITFLKENKELKLKVGIQQININKFNIYIGLIKLAKSTALDMNKNENWFKIISMYEQNISNYLEFARTPINKVFFIGAKDRGEGEAYSSLDTIKYIYSNISDNVEDFSEGQNIKKDSIIPIIQSYLVKNPTSKIVVYLGLHGTSSGLTSYDGYYFSKLEIEQLRNLSSLYNMTLIIDSCYDGQKFFDKPMTGNIILTSNFEKSISLGYPSLFIESYHYKNSNKNERNGNFLTKGGIPSFEEANLYSIINNEIGYIHISYKYNGKNINLN